jgi:hypothetical protein
VIYKPPFLAGGRLLFSKQCAWRENTARTIAKAQIETIQFGELYYEENDLLVPAGFYGSFSCLFSGVQG